MPLLSRKQIKAIAQVKHFGGLQRDMYYKKQLAPGCIYVAALLPEIKELQKTKLI